MLNLGQNWWFFVPCDLEIWWMTLENNRAPLLYYIKLCASFQSHGRIETGVTVRKTLNSGRRCFVTLNKANLRDLIAATGLIISNWIQIVNFSARVIVKFDGWPRKSIGHFYTASSFLHHLKSIGEFKLDLQSRKAQFGSNRWYVIPCDLEIWWMTLGKQ